MLDATQAAGLVRRCELDWADAVVGAGYKWLLCPRGSAWLALHPLWESDPEWTPVPHTAGWYGGRDRWGDLYDAGPAPARTVRRGWTRHRTGSARSVPR